MVSQGLIPIPGTTKSKRLEKIWASCGVQSIEEEMKEMRGIIVAAKPHGNTYSEGMPAMVGH